MSGLLGGEHVVVQKLAQRNQRYLQYRDGLYYFRYVVPERVRRLSPGIPREIRKSLSTDDYLTAQNLVGRKRRLISLMKMTNDPQQLQALCGRLSDFNESFNQHVQTELNALSVVEGSRLPVGNVKALKDEEPEDTTPTLSEAWQGFVQTKSWSERLAANNQRLFDTVLHFIGDVPVGSVTKADLKSMLSSVTQLPQRNKKKYKGLALDKLVEMDVPVEDRLSSKSVKEHLKLCQGLFNTYLTKDLEVLDRSPTDGVSYEIETIRYASLSDAEVMRLLQRSHEKPEWFQWFLLLAAYSGARRSELGRLQVDDFKQCPDTGRHYFVIRKGKTVAAKRQVPLHGELIRLGFLVWVAEQGGLLFPVAHTNGNRVTDMFTSIAEQKVNDMGERVVLHSMRHTFITKARAAGIETALVQQVVGHEKSGAGLTDRYTHRFPLKAVLGVVDSVGYGEFSDRKI